MFSVFKRNNLFTSFPICLRSLLSLIAAYSIVFAGIVYAEEYKVATVNLTRLLNDSLAAKMEKKKLEEMTRRKKEEIEKKKEAIKKLEAKLEKSGLSPHSEQADEIRSQVRSLARFVEDSEDELKQQYVRVTKNLMKMALDEIKQYATKYKYSLVLEKGDNDKSLVLYGDDSIDITEQVLKELNKHKNR